MTPTLLSPLLLLLILSVSTFTTFSPSECPIECVCGKVTTCSGGKRLTSLPILPSIQEVTRLEIHDYALSFLKTEDFYNSIFKNLSELSLSRNGLENETLVTTGNISDILNLSILDLSENKLRVFFGGRKLQNLRILDLSSNRLQQVRGLSELEKLESLRLRDNLISSLDPSLFQGLKFLSYINLDSNKLTSLDSSTFSNLPSLDHLILSSNPVEVTGWRTRPGFYWNSRIQFLDISQIRLTTVPSCLTSTIRSLSLAHNNLTIIKQSDFSQSYPNVGLLDLDGNDIGAVEDDAFGRLEYLKGLSLSGNRLSSVPRDLPPSLLSLGLGDNLITNLSSSDFRNLSNLTSLTLNRNRIPNLVPFVFSELTNLNHLDLKGNRIECIYHETFSRLQNLESLDLSQNPLKVIVTGAFSSLHKLSLLDINRLGESTLEFDPSSVFTGLDKLEILDASDSPFLVQKLFESKPSSLSTHLASLSELNVQRCGLVDINSVGSVLLEMGESLSVVKLTGNPWDCESESDAHELINRNVIVDAPTCEEPPEMKGTLLSSLNVSQFSPKDEPFLSLIEEESEMMEYDGGESSQLNQSLSSAGESNHFSTSSVDNNVTSHPGGESSDTAAGESASNDKVGEMRTQNPPNESTKDGTKSESSTKYSIEDNILQPTASYFAGDNRFSSGLELQSVDTDEGGSSSSALHLRTPAEDPPSGGVVVKTIIISAAACFISVSLMGFLALRYLHMRDMKRRFEITISDNNKQLSPKRKDAGVYHIS